MTIINGIIGGGLEGGSFSPLELLPIAWYQSDSLITLGTGTEIATWGDLSGNGFTLTSTFPAADPTYSLTGNKVANQPCVLFGNEESGGQLLNTSFSIAPNGFPLEIFAVATTFTSSPLSNYFLMDFGTAGSPGVNEIWQQIGTSTINFGGAVSGEITTSITINQPFILNAINNGTGQSTLTIDNTSSGTPTGLNNGVFTSNLTVGHYSGSAGASAFSWFGEIYSIIIFDRQLYSNERIAVLNYLSAKYGISI